MCLPRQNKSGEKRREGAKRREKEEEEEGKGREGGRERERWAGASVANAYDISQDVRFLGVP